MNKISSIILGVFILACSTFAFNSNYGEAGDIPWTKLKIVEITSYPAENGLPSRIFFQFQRPSTGAVVYTGYITVNTNKELLASLLAAYSNDWGVAIEWANENGNMDGSAKLHIRK